MSKNNKQWQDETDKLMDTEPNYKALLYCILNSDSTADKALRDMGVYARQRQPAYNEVENNPYVSGKIV